MREGKEREGIGVRSFEVSLLCLMLTLLMREGERGKGLV